jgi:hypothetical protein
MRKIILISLTAGVLTACTPAEQNGIGGIIFGAAASQILQDAF